MGNVKKHKIKKHERITESSVESSVYMTKCYAAVYGVSMLCIAAVNIDAANRGLPLDSVKNILTDASMGLIGGYSLVSLVQEVKALGSNALKNINEINRSK